MFINYFFRCTGPDCNHTDEFLVEKQERDTPVPCPKCLTYEMHRSFAPPNIRTEKLSKSYLDNTSIGGGRPKSQGFEDVKKISDLQIEQLNHKPGSERHAEIAVEISERKKIKLV